MESAPRTVEVFGDDDVPESVTWQAVTLMRSEWPSLFAAGLRWITRPFEEDVAPRYVVVRHGEVVMSHAVVLDVPADVHRTGLRVAGVASVLTSPPYRGEGHATAVLRAAGGLVDEGGFDVAGLFCAPALEPFYARAGWSVCPGGTVEDDADHASTDLRMMRFLSPAGRAAERRLREEPLHVGWCW
ncbi:GNAT family N-acetyltransferase [Cellulomonas fimi]|uniref:GNAT family N-acetyltransferase n=1 Tax=Cellulomonas fimi TaxID=1708 RepID=UPI00234D2934|nr:GNAT family N-acetyltransferase [Cellulomonas fimi]MDC7120043.1 GNAT family N-acetyltransferase [Cellulomonas fimi]